MSTTSSGVERTSSTATTTATSNATATSKSSTIDNLLSKKGALPGLTVGALAVIVILAYITRRMRRGNASSMQPPTPMTTYNSGPPSNFEPTFVPVGPPSTSYSSYMMPEMPGPYMGLSGPIGPIGVPASFAGRIVHSTPKPSPAQTPSWSLANSFHPAPPPLPSQQYPYNLAPSSGYAPPVQMPLSPPPQHYYPNPSSSPPLHVPPMPAVVQQRLEYSRPEPTNTPPEVPRSQQQYFRGSDGNTVLNWDSHAAEAHPSSSGLGSHTAPASSSTTNAGTPGGRATELSAV
ncbi:hypothetical protein C8F01DRAFT_1190159, partial [Mycena amicta]